MADIGADTQIAEAKQEYDMSSFHRNIKHVHLRRLQLGKELVALDDQERQYKEGIETCKDNLLQIREEMKKNG